ncbi:flagellar biosynthesis protein FlhF [Fervidibacillus albus]|uniref:Flagellar biosynthesis protein FlhF n=1 Tax=Fervidibacillus albus TaxID=2980026 RepID=A0A9E8LWG7_9BACI|nr:flagellar biosynthesis protein FlhF [Fervidibacillus albus]WAA10732.1 flagellar biosynthesis protein FlhF [Fervidibacillus albus]
MKVKKYVAENMQEAMKQIRSDLGRDAIILNSREIHKNGPFRIFRKKRIEVIAAVDNERPFPRIGIEQEPHRRNIRSKMDAGTGTKTDGDMLVKEITSLKNMVANITHQSTEVGKVPPPFRALLTRLSKQGIHDGILDELTDFLFEKYYEKGRNVSESDVKTYATEFLIEKLRSISFGGMDLQKKLVMCFGPTGVGKTTTLAKLAAYAKLDLQKSVAFITTDTYRIGAVEQLRTYAKLLDVPVEVCYTANDFQRAVNQFQSYDVTFIDTAGRNFRHSEYVHQLNHLVDFTRDMETFLVFSITAKEDDMSEIYEQFSNVPIDKFIFTKIDETESYGSMVNIPLKYKKPIGYITTGQDVPDDIIECTVHTIVNRIVGE